MSNEPGGPARFPTPTPSPTRPRRPRSRPAGTRPWHRAGTRRCATPVGEAGDDAGRRRARSRRRYGDGPGHGPRTACRRRRQRVRAAATHLRQQPGTRATSLRSPQYGAPQYGSRTPVRTSPAVRSSYPGTSRRRRPTARSRTGTASRTGHAAHRRHGDRVLRHQHGRPPVLRRPARPGRLGLGIAALRRIRSPARRAAGGPSRASSSARSASCRCSRSPRTSSSSSGSSAPRAARSGIWDEFEQGFEEGLEEGSDDGRDRRDVGEQLPDFALRTDLTAGTCLTTYAWEYDMADTDPVDCAVPHEAEVVALVP